MKKTLKWFLGAIVLIVIAFGWKYPWLGFIVPFAMLAGIIGGLFNGRYVCGNVCPRGAFYDKYLSLISPKKTFPKFLYTKNFRLLFIATLLAITLPIILVNPGSLLHWGFVFWFLCTITTAFGIFLGVLYHHRAWCVFCPVGTIAGMLNRKAKTLAVNSEECVLCKRCEKVCPMQLKIIKDETRTVIDSASCIQCGECVERCPKKAMYWKNK